MLIPHVNGYVTHKVRSSHYKGHFTCWLDTEGTLTDALQIRSDGKPNSVPRNGPLWELLQQRVHTRLGFHLYRLQLQKSGA